MPRAKGERRRQPRHAAETAWAHVHEHHPNCPPEIAERLVKLIAKRVWQPPVTLGQAFGIVATTFVRHRLTDYDQLFEIKGLTREEARIIVAPSLHAILEGWKR